MHAIIFASGFSTFPCLSLSEEKRVNNLLLADVTKFLGICFTFFATDGVHFHLAVLILKHLNALSFIGLAIFPCQEFNFVSRILFI